MSAYYSSYQKVNLCINGFLFLQYYVFMFIVRNEGFDTDIETMQGKCMQQEWILYYLREFIFWLGSRFVYYVFQDEFFPFYLWT